MISKGAKLIHCADPCHTAYQDRTAKNMVNLSESQPLPSGLEAETEAK
jgi:hypothetical protein